MNVCRFCGGDLWIVSKWSTAKLIGFWVGMLFCLLGLFALFIPNEKFMECRKCGCRQ